MKLITILLLLIAIPVYAGGRHNPPPVPTDTPDRGGSNFWNNLGEGALWAVSICGICYMADGCRVPFTKKTVCKFESKPNTLEGSIVPEIPHNEYTYELKP